MTSDEISIVKQSWQKFVPLSQSAGELFYDRLSEIKPDLLINYNQEHIEQVRSLMTSLNIIIDKLDDPYSILSIYQSMGNNKIGYGVLENDYESSITALEWILEQGLGMDFTPEVRKAWSHAFSLMSSMLNSGNVVIH